MNGSGGTWPEQNAVDAWLAKHGIQVDFKVAMELKQSTTAYRIEVQQERDTLKEAADRAASLPELQPIGIVVGHQEPGVATVRWLDSGLRPVGMRVFNGDQTTPLSAKQERSE